MFGKRLIDIAISLFALTLFLPFFAVIAIIIRIELGSPILFKQNRVGEFGENFTIYKFRTMKDIKHPKFSKCITRNTRIIRWFGLDELPQFYNILIGDMSFVGPRPSMPNWFKKCNGYELYADRLIVKPGLVPVHMARGYPAKKRHIIYTDDCDYATRPITFLGDVRIVLKTIIYLLNIKTYKEILPNDAIEA
ncbi:sugar transferase [bacterium]|nr:sugar transferase [bacterium]